MPLYEYECVDCETRDTRIGSLDDDVAVCHACGGLMLRLDDPFEDQEPAKCAEK